jgi:GT2 family glycosyltransferase
MAWISKTIRNVVVCIPTYKRYNNGLLEKCIDKYLENNGYGDKFKVIIYDDASGPSPAKVTSSIYKLCEAVGLKKDVTVRAGAKNFGIGYARKRLLKAAGQVTNRDDMVFFLDDDAYMRKNCLKNIIKAFDREKEAGVMGVFGSWRAFYFDRTKPFSMLGTGVAWGLRALLHHDLKLTFDTRFRAREDGDFQLQVWLSGWKIMVDPKSDVDHVRSQANKHGKGHSQGGLAGTTSEDSVEKYKMMQYRKYKHIMSFDKAGRLKCMAALKRLYREGKIVQQSV